MSTKNTVSDPSASVRNAEHRPGLSAALLGLALVPWLMLTNQGSGHPDASQVVPDGHPGAFSAAAPVQGSIEVDVETLLENLDNVVGVYDAGDGSGRLFIVEKKGLILIYRNGALEAEPFLDIQDRVHTPVSESDERGLLGMAFDPGFPTPSYFYVDYVSDEGRGTTFVSRFTVPHNADRVSADWEQRLLSVPQNLHSNHKGGQLAFGPDHNLYVALGDGGGGGDPEGNGQDLTDLHGSILRLDVSGDGEYAIPADNPFVARSSARGEIWAWGLRNPWRFSFDRQTGDLYIADVGQNQWEEVDFQPAGDPGGENYGWNIMEGTHCYGGGNCRQNGLTLPVTEYQHAGGSCSITGGFVYRGSAYPAMEGRYFFSDWCSRKLWALARDGAGKWQTEEVGAVPFGPASFGEDESGELYVAGQGSVGRLRLVGAPTPGPTDSVAPTETSTPTDAPTAEPSNTATSTVAAPATLEPSAMILYVPVFERP